MSLSALAARTAVSKSHLGNLETGDRPPTPEVAEAVDRALRAGGVLIELAAHERGGGDEMRRRALLATVAAAASLGTIDGPHALADMVRHGLLEAAGAAEDWDGVVQDCGRRLVCDPSPLFGSALLTNLMVIRQQLEEAPTRVKPDLLRASAGLGQIYGLWLGNQDQLGGANHWYRSAALLADRSGDTDMQVYVLGRAASRGVYESWTIRETENTVGQALALSSRPTVGMLEAHAAQVSIAAITGDAETGRTAVHAMLDVADHLADTPIWEGVAAHERALFMWAFLEGRVGSLEEASAVCDRAEQALERMPTWLAETQVYRARAMVAAGDHAAGLEVALAAVSRLTHDVRVIAVAVRDVLSVLPVGYSSDVADELRRYADPNPGPWEMIGR
ncbi:helix-turn-helix transcriptional regulator [Micromonospora sp. CPCC 205371]|nr:helix-turn-helix transcriptional regulator [Micromonospora sp. CPCC 205371]